MEKDKMAEKELKAQKREYKADCERKAVAIVMRLVDVVVEPSFFADAGDYLSAAYYSDVIEERGIEGLCGYPLCHASLPKLRQQKYSISTKTNKVFDLTHRKKFCSTHCYHASNHYQAQLSNIPVWSREGVSKRPFTLLSSTNERCDPGEELVGLTLTQRQLQNVEEIENGEFLQTDDFEDHDETKTTTAKTTKKVTFSTFNKQTEDDFEDDDIAKTTSNKSEKVTFSAINKNIDDNVKNTIGDKTQMSIKIIERMPNSKQEYLSLTDINGDVPQNTFEDTREVNIDVTNKTTSNHCDFTDKEKEIVIENNVDNSTNNKSKLSEKGDLKILTQSESESYNESVGGVVKGVSNVNLNENLNLKTQEIQSNTNSNESLCIKTKAILSNNEGSSGKVDYLMRLLDQQKGKLAKIANIQENQVTMPIKNEINDSNKSKRTELTDIDQIDKIHSSHKITPIETHNTNNSGDLLVNTHNEENIDNEAKTRRRNINSNKIKSSDKNINFEDKSDIVSPSTVSTVHDVFNIIMTWRTEATSQYLKPSNSMDQNKHWNKKARQNTESDNSRIDWTRGYKKCDVFDDRASGDCRNPVDFNPNDTENKGINIESEKANNISQSGDDNVQENIEVNSDVNSDSKSTDTTTTFVSAANLIVSQTQDYQDKVKAFYQKYVDTSSVADGTREHIVPLVDSTSQGSLRRRIVLERLDKALREVIVPLKLTVQDVSGLMRELVGTFMLTSSTITFKPAQWYIVALFLLHVLAVKSTEISESLEHPASITYQTTILRSYQGTVQQLKELATTLLSG